MILMLKEIQTEISPYISYNSKDIKASTLFIAISGHKVDGHLFIEEAIKMEQKPLFMSWTDLLLPMMRILPG